MDTVIIFGAKYLIAASAAVAGFAFWRAPREMWKKNLSFAAILLPLSYILALGVRALWFNPRPFVVNSLVPLIPHAADNGFPSDHVLLAAALAAAVGYFDRKASLWLWLIALAIGMCRVAAHVHHAIDILGSMFIVLAAAHIVRAIMPALWKHKQTNS